MTTSGTPIIGIASLRGRTFRVIGEPVFVDAIRAMGANPVPLPFAELYQALKSKQVDAEDNFYSQILAGRLYEVQSSLTVTTHSYSALVRVANAQVWNGLTAEQQRLLRAAAIEAGKFERRLTRDEANQARAKLTAHGMRIYDLAKPELENLLEATQPVRSQYFNHYPEKLRKLYVSERGRLGE
jgi:TRAP-type C4-dicarboxylate transport system substrate-binding protein